MTGLCGFLRLDGEPVDPGWVEGMVAAAGFRKDSGAHVQTAGSVALASFGQPVASLRDQGLWVAADARLYECTGLGGRFSDSASLILEAYRKWGDACTDHLVGDFAFVVWDQLKGRLLCARDIVGARPFHYSHRSPHPGSGLFAFASDPAPILSLEAVPKDLDGTALCDFLCANFNASHRSMFAAIQRLLPGHLLTLGKEGPHARRYWQPSCGAETVSGDEEEYAEAFLEVLRRSVSQRMVSATGNVGLMTSGGLDSSAIAALAQEDHRLNGSARPIAFVGVFSRHEQCDERSYTAKLQESTAIALEEIVVDELEEEPSTKDSGPLGHPSLLSGAFTRHVLQRFRGRECDVLMNGFGGDSLFDAARLQPFDLVRRGLWWKLGPWISAARKAGASPLGALRTLILRPLVPEQGRRWWDRIQGSARYHHVPPWIDPDLRRRLDLNRRLRRRIFPLQVRSGARQLQYEHIVGLAQQGPAIDSWAFNTARAGIEARFPLLDQRLAELVLAAPLALGAKPGLSGTKWLLRASMSGLLPEEIRLRPGKTSWNSLRETTFRHRQRKHLRSLFSGSRMASYGLIDEQVLLERFDAYCEDPSREASANIFSFPFLLERWLREHAPAGAGLSFEPLQDWQRER